MTNNPGRECGYDSISLGDIVTVRYAVDRGRETRTTKLKVIYATIGGWMGQSVKVGWTKRITPDNCEILRIKKSK